tara:strand:+ start:976 stop:1872 length:897 start_codon:yes stop_codon:yes gene_type:complete
MTTYEVRPYQDAQDESFEKSGLPDADKDDYDSGWDEQMQKEEELKAMKNEDYDAKLGEATEIINFNGMMTMFKDPAHNGKMTEYIMGQIMYGYAPPTLGIGYEVQIVDWVHNPDPENFVVVSSKELVPDMMAAPLVKAAGGHWTLYLRKENLKMFLPPDVVETQKEVIAQDGIAGKISEVIYSGYVGLGQKVSISGRMGDVEGRGRLCVELATGNLRKMETPERGWMFVESEKIDGVRIDTTIEAIAEWAKDKDITIVSLEPTEIVLQTPQAKSLGKKIDRWEFFYVESDGDTLTVGY